MIIEEGFPRVPRMQGGIAVGQGDLNTTKQNEKKTTFLNSNKINQTNLRH
jgi:hypothetical protein